VSLSRSRLLQPEGSLSAPGHATAEGDFPTLFGELEPWDTYYLSSNYVVLDQFYGPTATEHGIDPYSDFFRDAFVRNLVHVDTFLTHAGLDLVIWAPSIPETLRRGSSLVSDVVVDESLPVGAPRPGVITVTYAVDLDGLPGSDSRTIRFPSYAVSSHAATLDQPIELRDDIRAWLEP
jgi:hypothetical protein